MPEPEITIQRKRVTVTIKMPWLLYDIKNETYLRGRTIQNKDNHKEVASMYASEDEENLEKILRSIKKGFAEVKSVLSEYLAEGSDTAVDNSHLDFTKNLALNLEMPSNFNDAAAAGIGEAVHDYLKNIAIAEWYLVTDKADSEDYFALANKSMTAIQQAVSKRARPKRPIS
mgnify:CR=1 FL=1